MKATDIYTERFKTKLQLAKRVLKAIEDIQGYEAGTLEKPSNLAATPMEDGRTLIQTVLEDGMVEYNDGFFIVEVNDVYLYVDVTGVALRECPDYKNLKCIYSKGLKPVEEKDDNLRSVKAIIQENIDKKIGKDNDESIFTNRLRNNQKL